MNAEITGHADDPVARRKRALLEVVQRRCTLDELVAASGDGGQEIAECAKDLAYAEMALAQVQVGCGHDLEAGWCLTHAVVDPSYECEIHTGPNSTVGGRD